MLCVRAWRGVRRVEIVLLKTLSMLGLDGERREEGTAVHKTVLVNCCHIFFTSTYTALLNTTTKQVASVAACLTILSYVSTAVVCSDITVF